MTREQAVTILKHNISACLRGTEWGEALNMAIKALEQEPTTKNDLGVDCISRISALDSINWAYNLSDAYQKINDLPSVTPQQTFKWCTDCKEYDQEKHCCHRWSKVIRDTVEEMKQEYIERDVLDKLRAEIKQIKPSQGHFYDGVAKCLEILDKYKAESEADNG